MTTHALTISNYHPLITPEDKTGTDILKMSDFSAVAVNSLGAEIMEVPAINDLSVISDLSILTETIASGRYVIFGNEMYVADFNALPADIKKEYMEGLLKIGESKQVDGNWRATLVTAAGKEVRAKDITLKKVVDTTGALDSLRALSVQMQLKNLTNSIDNLTLLTVYLVQRDRDVNIKAHFINARDYILKGQECSDVNMKLEYLRKADEYMNAGFTSIYLDMETVSKEMIRRNKKINLPTAFNQYMNFLYEDIMISNKMMGLRQSLLYTLGEYKQMNNCIEAYRNNMMKLLQGENGDFNKSAIGIMQGRYPYSKSNIDCWYNFAINAKPLLKDQEQLMHIENKYIEDQLSYAEQEDNSDGK